MGGIWNCDRSIRWIRVSGIGGSGGLEVGWWKVLCFVFFVDFVVELQRYWYETLFNPRIAIP